MDVHNQLLLLRRIRGRLLFKTTCVNSINPGRGPYQASLEPVAMRQLVATGHPPPPTLPVQSKGRWLEWRAGTGCCYRLSLDFSAGGRPG